MTNRNLYDYFKRWQALDALIEQTRKYYGSALNAQDQRREVIVYLLTCLRAFAAGQFQFFYHGLEPSVRQPGDPILQKWDEFPTEDILIAIIEQTSHDLALIQRAADQRLAPAMQAALKQADSLATLALQPAIKGKVIEPPATVLTYFEKTAEFYNIPYANVALISIPFTCTGPKKDFLAIPHEAGHYVYRHLKTQAQADLKQLRLLPRVSSVYQDWARAVFEELCADIYGCLVGGPVMALDFQDLCLANAQPSFTGGDGEHPNPALRPLIYCQVLDSPLMQKVNNGNFATIAHKLAQQWDDSLEQRHANTFAVTDTLTPANFGGGAQGYSIENSINPVKSITPDRPRGPIGEIVDEVVRTILGSIVHYLGENATIAPMDTWSGPNADQVDITKLEDVFTERFDALVAQHARDKTLTDPDLDPCEIDTNPDGSWPRTPKSWLDWVQRHNSDLKKPWPALWTPDETILSGEVRNRDRMKPNTWGYILYADGWATGGPSDNSSGHPEM